MWYRLCGQLLRQQPTCEEDKMVLEELVFFLVGVILMMIWWLLVVFRRILWRFGLVIGFVFNIMLMPLRWKEPSSWLLQRAVVLMQVLIHVPNFL
jgi:hypothetical protein